MYLRRAVAAVTAGMLIAVAQAVPAHAAVSRAELAQRWAPVHYQDVDATGSHALGGRADMITYLFFHPRDWIDHPFFETEHENDGEGVLIVVERDGSDHGVLRAAVTVAHSDFFSYTPAGSTWANGSETIDGTLRTASSPHDAFAHPVTAQEARGHGLKAYPQYAIDGDGIVYYPSLTTAEAPSGADDRDVRYRLVDVFASGGLWAQRNTTSLFASLGTFAGDRSGGCGTGTWSCGTDSANAPWGWDDGDDAVARGEIATDPAKLAASYFTAPGTIARTYTFNPYTAAAAALREAARVLPPTVD